MTRRLAGAAAILSGPLLLALAGTCALSGAASADSFTPVRLAITIAPVARLDRPLKITVAVSADAGALDSATAPLRIRVKLAGECGGEFPDSPGATLLDAQLSPQPTTGAAYSATASGSGLPAAYGVQTVCAYLEEEGDDRQFATDTDLTVDVSRPCTAAADRYDDAHHALGTARQELARASSARRASLSALVRHRRTATIADDRAAIRACGTGVPLS